MTINKVDIEVSSNGTIREVIKETEALSAALKRAGDKADDLAKRTAAKVNKTKSTASRGAKQEIDDIDDFANETKNYKKNRGITGSGSAAKDFGRQASGLGGLVHVYATFAANIYALSTAFTKLKEAADTSNMSKGLDQLGTTSGRNLNALAKQLVAAADGAVSLKEAMAATASASAGGLDGGQLLRLTNVAKNASQALGRDMPDALNRLTRGITKIEPELLDELGILVKVDMANQNYARSLGKTAASLTDLEKRQAFATEAITQGERKFNSIKLDSNPYTKLQATMADSFQVGLELLNKVLLPIASILSSNPIALGASLAALATILIKQALPGITEWRAGIKAAANDADIAAKNSAELAAAMRAKTTAGIKEALDARLRDQRLNADQIIQIEREKIKAGLTKGGLGPKTQTFAKFNVDPQELSKGDFDQLSTYISRREGLVKKHQANLLLAETAGDKAVLESKIATSTAQIAILKATHAEALTAARTATALEAQIELDSVTYKEALNKREVLSYSQSRIQKEAIAAASRKKMADIVQMSSELSKSEGFSTVFSAGKAAVAEAGITGIAKATTLTKVALVGMASAAKGALSTLMVWLGPVLIAIELASWAIDKFSGNTKKVEVLNESLKTLASTSEHVGKVLQEISEKDPMQQLSVSSISAKSNAMSELSSNLQKVVKDFEAATLATTRFGGMVDTVKKLWGGDLKTKMSEGLAQSIVKAVELADGAVKETLISSVSDILNTTDLTVDNIEDKISSSNNLTAVYLRLATAQEQAAAATKKHSSSLENLKESLSTTAKSANDLMTSLAPSDNFSKYALSVIRSSIAMKDSISNTETAYSALLAIMSDSSNLSALDGDAKTKLISDSTKLASRYSEEIDLLTKYNKERTKSVEINKKIIDQSNTPTSAKLDAKKANEVMQKDISKSEERIEVLNKKRNTDSVAIVSEAVKSSIAFGAKLLETSVNNSFKQAALTVAKAAAAGLQGPGAAKVALELKNRELALQRDRINSEISLVISQSSVKDQMANLADKLELNTLALQRSALELASSGKGKKAEVATANLARLNNSLTSSTTAEKTSSQVSGITKRIASSKLDGAAKISSLKKEAENPENSDETKAVMKAKAIELAGAEASLRNISAESRAATITAELEALKETLSIKTELFAKQKAERDDKVKEISLAQEATNIYSASLEQRKGALIAEQAIGNVQLENAKHQALMDELNTRAKTLGEGTVKTFKDKAIQDHADKLSALDREANLNQIQFIKESAAKRLANDDRLRTEAMKDFEITQSNSKVVMDTANFELQQKIQLGQISEELAAKSAANMAIEIAEAERLKKIKETENEQTKVTSEATNGFVNQNLANGGTADSAFIMNPEQLEYLDKQDKYYGALKDSINDASSAEKKRAKSTAATTIELNKQAKAMNQLERFSSVLEKVFGKFGKAVGTVGTTIVKAGSQLEKMAAQKKNDLAGLDKASQEYRDKDMEGTKEAAAVSFAAAADVAGAVAESFDEQSSAAAAFHKLQKVFHLMELAMNAEKLISTITTSAASAYASVMSYIPAIFAKSMADFNPVIGFGIAAAAIAALGFSGGGSSAPKAPTSEQKKEVQGTGEYYDSNGVKQRTGYGVLGDDTAKSESIANSLEFIKQYTFDNLEYSNKMLSSLQGIEIGITGVSRGVATSKGLTSGTAFNTLEGSTKAFGSLGGLVGGILGSVFGGKTTTSITGSGISLGGTVGSVAQGATGAKQYETGTTKTSGGWFSRDKTSSFTNEQALDATASKAIKDVFASLSIGLTEAGSAIGLDSDALAKEIASIPVKLEIETRGMKGSEISEAVSAVLSSTMDMVAEKALSIVKPFQDLNEGLSETAFRVARTSQVIDLQLKSVGMAFNAVGVDSLAARMSLVDMSGGLEEFMSNSDFFKDNFLTEAERLVPVQKAVVDEMNRLGLSTVTTVEGFKSLVLSLDLTKQADAKLYTSLMGVQKGFIEVYKSVDITASKLEMSNKALEIFGTRLQVQAATRKRELAALSEAERPMQAWIYALEDEAEARLALKEAYDEEVDARQNTIDRLKESIATLKDFSLSLALGSASPLTPKQKYDTSKAEYESIKAILTDPSVSKEDKLAALEKLPDSISAFLETSKVYYASSAQYQRDYADAQTTLALKIADSKAQLSIEEASLAQLKAQGSTLLGIESAILTFAQAFNAFAAASAAADAAALLANISKEQVLAGTVNPSIEASKPRFDPPTNNYVGNGSVAPGLGDVFQVPAFNGTTGTNASNMGPNKPSDRFNEYYSGGGIKEMTDSVVYQMEALRKEVSNLKESNTRDAEMLAVSQIESSRESADTIANSIADGGSLDSFKKNYKVALV